MIIGIPLIPLVGIFGPEPDAAAWAFLRVVVASALLVLGIRLLGRIRICDESPSEISRNGLN